MWELEFLSHRIGEHANHRYNFGISVSHPAGKNEWYCKKLKKWGGLDDFKEFGCSTICEVSTLRGFKRHLRTHPELKEMNSVLLVSRLEGHGVCARWVENK